MEIPFIQKSSVLLLSLPPGGSLTENRRFSFAHPPLCKIDHWRCRPSGWWMSLYVVLCQVIGRLTTRWYLLSYICPAWLEKGVKIGHWCRTPSRVNKELWLWPTTGLNYRNKRGFVLQEQNTGLQKNPKKRDERNDVKRILYTGCWI